MNETSPAVQYTEYRNCTYVTEDRKPARRIPSGNCPIHGST